MKYSLLILALLTSTAHADTWTVDDDGKADFDNIQAAIDSSSDGDEIVVMPGTYTSTDYSVGYLLNKDITIRSDQGPSVTIIDGQETRRCLELYSANGSTIDGFTIIRGVDTGSRSGGIYCYEADDVTIQNCIIKNNSSPYGGGAHIYYSDNCLIDSCAIYDNTVTSSGAGINIHSSTLSISNTSVGCNEGDNQIDGSWTDLGGNCITEACFDENDNGNPDNCECQGYGLRGNVTYYVDDDFVDLECPNFVTIQDAINAASDGDEIVVMPGTYTSIYSSVGYLLNKDITIRSDQGPSVTIIDGQETRRCLELYSANGSTIDGFTIIRGVDTGSRSGGIYCYEADDVTIQNCIIKNNSSPYGGGAHIYYSDNCLIDSCAIYDNTVTSSGAGINIHSSTLSISNTSVGCNEGDNQIDGSWTDLGGNCITEACFDENDNGNPDNCECQGYGLRGNVTYYVDDDFVDLECPNFVTIQDAINAASDGDEIVVMPGTYTSIYSSVGYLLNKDITIRSDQGPSVTIIDGQETRRCLELYSANGSTIDGFTIIRGVDTGSRSGGIYCYEADDVTIQNCIIKNNSSPYGGGAHIYYSDNCLIDSCAIYDNTVTSSGAGINIHSSTLSISNTSVGCNEGDNQIDGSWTDLGGNCITEACFDENDNGNPDNCECQGYGLRGNVTYYVDDDFVDLECPNFVTIQDAINAASDGDEIVVMPGTYTSIYSSVGYLLNKDITIRSDQGPSVTIIDGQETRRCLELYSANGSTIDGFTIIRGVDTGSRSGGIYCYEADDVTIQNCIIKNNSSPYGGGAHIYYSDNCLIDSCAIYDNTVTSSGAGINIHSSTLSISNTSVGCNEGDNQIDGSWTDLGGNCITEACFDENDNGNPDNCECQGYGLRGNVTYYVDDDFVDLECPNFVTIQDAINAASDGDEIVVMPGTYTSIYSSVGYLNKDITIRSDQGPSVTIIDGQETRRCLYIESNASGSTIDGFTIIRGFDTSSYSGGIYCYGAHNVTIQNCIIKNNSSSNGGGAHIYYSDNCLIDSCAIYDNTVTSSGAGIRIYGYALSISNTSVGCNEGDKQIIGSWTDLGGNCITEACFDENDNGNPDNCECQGYGLRGNVTYYVDDDFVDLECPNFVTIQDAINAASDGDEIVVMPGTYTSSSNSVINIESKSINISTFGGPEETIIDGQSKRRCITIVDESESSISGFTLRNGIHNNYGGGVYTYYSSLTLDNVIITDCDSHYGGGIYCSQSTFTMHNSKIDECGADDKGGGIYLLDSNVSVGDCIIQQCLSDYSGGGVYISSCDGLISNSLVINNISTYSPAIEVYANSQFNILNCEIVQNYAQADNGYGYAVWVGGNSIVLSQNIIGCNDPLQINAGWTDDGNNCIAEICIDNNENDLPDDCESNFCEMADLNNDGHVSIDDMLLLIYNWGPCFDCNADFNNDDIVDVSDLLIVISNWGPCE